MAPGGALYCLWWDCDTAIRGARRRRAFPTSPANDYKLPSGSDHSHEDGINRGVSWSGMTCNGQGSAMECNDMQSSVMECNDMQCNRTPLLAPSSSLWLTGQLILPKPTFFFYFFGLGSKIDPKKKWVEPAQPTFFEKSGWSRLNPSFQTKLGWGGFTTICQKNGGTAAIHFVVEKKRVDSAQPTFVWKRWISLALRINNSFVQTAKKRWK